MKESYGKFAVISGETLLNIYDTREEALNKTVKTHKLGTFLVQQIVEKDKMSTGGCFGRSTGSY